MRYQLAVHVIAIQRSSDIIGNTYNVAFFQHPFSALESAGICQLVSKNFIGRGRFFLPTAIRLKAFHGKIISVRIPVALQRSENAFIRGHEIIINLVVEGKQSDKVHIVIFMIDILAVEQINVLVFVLYIFSVRRIGNFYNSENTVLQLYEISFLSPRRYTGIGEKQPVADVKIHNFPGFLQSDVQTGVPDGRYLFRFQINGKYRGKRAYRKIRIFLDFIGSYGIACGNLYKQNVVHDGDLRNRSVFIYVFLCNLSRIFNGKIVELYFFGGEILIDGEQSIRYCFRG